MKNDELLLSICIPTYNRSYWLGRCIEDCLSQIDQAGLGELVEVVISDNCSTDGTAEMIKKYDGRIVYSRNSDNIRCHNFGKVVSLASGRFSWLMGDDDAPLPGAIKKMAEIIQADPSRDAYILSCVDTTLDDRAIRQLCWLRDPQKTEYDLVRWVDRNECFGNLQSLAGIGGLISCVVAKTIPFSRGFDCTREWIGNNGFPHVAALVHMSSVAGKFKWILDPMVKFRVGNDDMSPTGIFDRILVDFESWQHLADNLFGVGNKNGGYSLFRQICRRHHGVATLPTLRGLSNLTPDRSWQRAKTSMLSIGYSQDCVELLESLDIRFDRKGSN